jgi:prolipoprotein diacylglyceryltransferase
MLNESFSCALVFVALYVAYWKTNIIKVPGRILGASLAACFSARFLIEFVKEDQVPFEKGMPLNMGQLLSIPFILLGIVFLFYGTWKTALMPK